MKQGLDRLHPDRRDYSLLHTYGALAPDPAGLPDNFSIYDGRVIPDQDEMDDRFTPAVRPLPYACTAEDRTFSAGLADGAVYPPDDFYFATSPGTDGVGRDMRLAFETAINHGFKLKDGSLVGKRRAYFNCYAAGQIDDFDAARIALWINQNEKRGVSVGSWWYPNWVGGNVPKSGILGLPSFNTKEATMHDWLITGWRTINGAVYLEGISWQGMFFGDHGKHYMSRPIYEALMAQPYTGAFTMTKFGSATPVPIGYQAILDHFVYFFRNLLGI